VKDKLGKLILPKAKPKADKTNDIDKLADI